MNKNKGQIFSMDLLFGAILVILAIGVLTSAAEINYYNQRQLIRQNELNQKTITGALILTNSIEWSCDFNGVHPAYSINIDKLNASDLNKIKQKANLINQKIRIKIGGEEEFSDLEDNQHQSVTAIKLDVLICDNQTIFSQLKQCIDGEEECTLEKKEFKLEVSE